MKYNFHKKYKKVIQIELNEVSLSIIDRLIKEGALPTFEYIQNNWSYKRTTSETEYEKIEPWIQWVTAHTGKTYDEHKIFHLGDVHDLNTPQVWEHLQTYGKSSLILGAMNAKQGSFSNGVFFPDPWSKTEQANTSELQGLWKFIAGSVQKHANNQPSYADIKRALRGCLKYNISPQLYFKIGSQLISQKINPKKKWKLAALFDLFLAQIFFQLIKENNYHFNILFLNSVAHYQHHFWRNFDNQLFNAGIHSPDCRTADNPIKYGYRVYDKILAKILKMKSDDTLVIVASGLSQLPYTEKEAEGGVNYYRLKDHYEFGEMLEIPRSNIFPCMSRDWQVQVDPSQVDTMKNLFSSIVCRNKPLFTVNQTSPGYLFIETAITEPISDELVFKGSQPLKRFSDLFTLIAVKSGHHSGMGSLWVSDKEFNQIVSTDKISLTHLPIISSNALGVSWA